MCCLDIFWEFGRCTAEWYAHFLGENRVKKQDMSIAPITKKFNLPENATLNAAYLHQCIKMHQPVAFILPYSQMQQRSTEGIKVQSQKIFNINYKMNFTYCYQNK